jgi:alkylation response protein AidB-like acyl-CoA dehydrogenase
VQTTSGHTTPASNDVHPELTSLEDFRRDFRSWLESHLPSQSVPQGERQRFEYLREWQRTMHRGGWVGIAWPKRYGGKGLGPLHQFVYYEELAAANAPPMVNQPGLLLIGPALLLLGSEQAKERYLGRILSGEEIWCQGFSEPESGSDLASIRTEARRIAGERYVINGHKVWTSWAPLSDRCLLLCRTDREATRHRGLTAIMVDMHQRGVRTRPIRQMTGDEFEFGEVIFEDAIASRDDVLVGEGRGWDVALSILEIERSDVAYHDHSRLFSTLVRVRNQIRRVAKRREVNASDVLEARRRFSDSWMRCWLLRELNLGVALGRMRGEQIGDSGSIIQLFWSEVAQEVASLAYDIAGMAGEEARDVVHGYLQSRSTTIASGTAEIQRNIISERLLRLPR